MSARLSSGKPRIMRLQCGNRYANTVDSPAGQTAPSEPFTLDSSQALLSLMANPSSTPPSEVPVATIEHRHSAAEMFVEENKNKLILALVVIALLLIGYFVVQHWNRTKAEEAGAALTSATSVEDYRAVLTKYEDDSEVAGSAQLLLADALWKTDDQDGAYQTLKDFVANREDHPLYTKGISDLGLVEHMRGNFDAAIEQYKKVASTEGPDFIKELTLLRLGDAHVANGLAAMEADDTTTAEAHFEDARIAYDDLEATDNPNWNPPALERKERLQHLSIPASAPGTVEATPVEAEAPVSPETTEPSAETTEPSAETTEPSAETTDDQPTESPAETTELPVDQPVGETENSPNPETDTSAEETSEIEG